MQIARTTHPPLRRRIAAAATAAALALALASWAATGPAQGVSPANGSLVYSPAAGSSFNPEGGAPAGTTYAKIAALQHNGSANGDLVVTYDQLVLVGGVQVYPIHRSTDGGTTWTHVTDVVPSDDFPTLTRTAQPFLYELPEASGSLPAGTLLLGGMLMPEDRSSSRLVVYKSTDQGDSWSLLSTIDSGGPAVYDPSPSSTTTTVWEPSFAVDAYGGLVAYYSDERQKADDVLQAVSYRRSTDGGQSWGPLVNVSAPDNQSDRPGMITVAKLPNGTYIATFEVVNRPSQSQNAAPVYFKTSPDGLDWGSETSVGQPIELEDGRGIGSSPFVTWVPSGGPQGTLVVASMWSLDSSGAIDGGQNLYVNYALGQGPWERLPMPVTFDATDTQGGNFSGFAQGLAVAPDGRTLYQAVNVENLNTGLNDIRVGSMRVDAQQYEAELATINDASLVTHPQASNGSKVGNINNSGSYVEFEVDAPAGGNYTLSVRYANGTGATASHALAVNGVSATAVTYPATVDWGRYQWSTAGVSLVAGTNTIRLAKGTGFAEVDVVHLDRASALAPQFTLANRNSGKLLEVFDAETTDGAAVGQWTDNGHPTQRWRVVDDGSVVQLENVNSGKLLEIPSAQTADGIDAVQWGPTGHPTQDWTAQSDGGWWTFDNANSGKRLEIDSCSTDDGAVAQQWPANGAPCQEWRLVREGIQ
ncbi:RICIN domain-containing protein [Demequina aestuarii]|uniref:RICIN domain-containing protein n=1 Tax=Demequina aestuarii TaxID=327095 RepID=UPI000786587F|nr:RICIN domain-containing protein [Demequina aestuarii]